MNVISSGNLKKESNSSGTYTIVIDDFKKKVAKSAVGERSTTEEFCINWSKFSIRLYITGDKENQGYLSLFLHNKSDWMIRARFEVSVKVMGREGGVLKDNLHYCFKDEVFCSLGAFERVYQPKAQPKENQWGWKKCLPHSRCVPGDLLSPDGSLTIQVKINLLGENCPGGIQDQSGLKVNLDKLDKKLTGIKSKLDTELPEIKSKLRKIESVVEGIQGGL